MIQKLIELLTMFDKWCKKDRSCGSCHDVSYKVEPDEHENPHIREG